MKGDVAFSPPAGWVEADIAPPALGAGSDIGIDRWSAWRAADGGTGRAAVGCFGLDVSTWAEEAMPIAVERLTAITRTVAASLGAPGGLHVADELPTGAILAQSLVTSEAADGHAVARTFLGFTAPQGHPRLRGCFAICNAESPECAASLKGAAVTSGFVAAPPANAGLRALVLGVHHPRGVALGCISLFFALGVVAVWTRPRPRRK